MSIITRAVWAGDMVMGVVVVRRVRFWEDGEARVKPVVVSKDQGCEDGPNVAFKGVVATMARVGLC